ncbi:hypothetical protein BKA61DRAFT_659063 [Leptodontidium sp. MPI-SDFR-AT-0119]|nr:hypothetical protein BKA61DRAFT_659063 [Leptodontidium sp. MPI-SDFR-AT-0119]
MPPTDSKLLLFLDETLPADEGGSLLRTFVADVRCPTNRYEPKSASNPRQHPFLKPDDILKPYVEDRTITAGTSSGRAFETGLFSFISGNTNSSNSRQAELISKSITTYSLRSPDDVFNKIRNDEKYWQQVEDLPHADERHRKATSKNRSHGGELTLPLIEAATGGLNLPAGIIIGDPRLVASCDRGTSASQSGLVEGERLFAIQYWALVKKRQTERKRKGKHFKWPKSKRTEGIQARPPRGKHIMFHGNDDSSNDGDDSDDKAEEDQDN